MSIINFEAGIPVWVPKLGAQKSFLVQYILSSIRSDKYLDAKIYFKLKFRQGWMLKFTSNSNLV